MRLIVTAGLLMLAAIGTTGCVGAGPDVASGDPSARYTISRQRPNVMLTGRPVRNLIAGANLNPGEVAAVLDANPGLREALLRNGYDLSRITGLRISPTNVVDVYTKG